MPTLIYEGKEYPLKGDVFLGRHRDCTIPISDGKASRKHSRVFSKDDGTVWVEDLDSANGTAVNGEEIFSPRKLMDGDRVIIGKAKVTFKGDSVETTPATGSPIVADPKELIGQLLGGYRIGELVASGSMGVVYKARQLSLGRDVAVKVFNADLTKRSAGFAERFLKEARVAGSIQHPNVVQIHECGQEGNLLWYSMELVDGGTLDDMVTRDGRLDPALALIVAEQAASALQAAHAKGVVHRDVTPANLMLSKEGKIKLLDLGLAQVLNTGRTAGKKTVVGNPWYMSPERAKGEPGDARADIYSLGCTLFHLLTGEPPYDADSPKAILKAHVERPIPDAAEKVPGLPKKLDELLHSMLSKNPEWRYASMDEVLTDLRAAREALPRTAPGKAKPATPVPGEAANLAAIAAERAGQRNERAQEHRTRRFITWVVILVAIGLVYAFSGVSLSALLRNHTWQGASQSEIGAGLDDPAASQPVTVVHPGDGASPVIAVDNRANGPGAQKWKAAQLEIDGQMRQGNWGAAEIRLAAVTTALAKEPDAAELSQSIRLKREQMQLDGDAWFRKQITALPAATTAAAVAPRLARLGELRDVALSANRDEADSLYQELVTKLDQQLNATRRQARQQIEGGHPEVLSKLASDLEPWFTGTPLAGVYRQFKALAGEAAGAGALMRPEWAATRQALLAAKGVNALAAGAVLILVGLPAEAKRMLLNDPALAQGDALRRREALFGREAAILSFSDIGDLQFIETLQGDVRMDGGVLTGAPGEACGLAITVPVGGDTWSAALVLTLKDRGKDGQAVISLVKGDNADLMLRIDPDKLALKVHSVAGWEHVEPARPKDAVLRVRMTCRGGRLQVLVNNQTINETAKAHIAPGSQLRLELAGVDWKLDEVQVVGGE